MTAELSLEDKVEALWSRAGIEKVMTDLGRSLDQQDWPLYRSCFGDTVDINFERTLGFKEVRVDADTWTRLAEQLLTSVRTHHTFSNYAIELDGDRASATIYLVARHWAATDNGSSEFIQNGWYKNRFVHVGGEWKVSRLLHTHQWTSGNGALFGAPSPAGAALMQQVFCEANIVPESELQV
jgi:hypothetical protein